MSNNLTVIQRNNLYEALVSDLKYAEELMKEFHEDLPDEFTFLEMKRLCEWIDGAKDKREVYAILKHSNMKKFEQGDDQYYMYWGTLYHYENDTYHQHVEYNISRLIDLIEYNIEIFKNRPVIKGALEDIDIFKLARYNDQIEDAKNLIDRAKEQYESIVKRQNTLIYDLQKQIKELESKKSNELEERK